MIYEIRSYRLKPGSLAEVVKRFGDAYEHRQRYSRLAGFFQAEIGPLNEIVQVWPYHDLAERVRVHAEVARGGQWPPRIQEFVTAIESEVVVPFPFVDAVAEKRRPSLVLSRQTFNHSSGHSICAMITTASRTRWASDIVIQNLRAAGLPRPCVVRWKLFTLPNEIILRRAGSLGKEDRQNVIQAARTIID